MALKNLFDMVKADRYTADGREEIIKAQEAEIEDATRRTYQIGEISEKTGLQKTAQGWKPPKETKFGKVQQKNGEWGVQTKTGKGSSFIKHKDEADAKRALANYTAGYNRAGRNKEDPHSDKARQIKHWNKETDQIAKKYREERRAAHAAQFQKPAVGSKLDAADQRDQIGGEIKGNLEAAKYYFDKAQSFSPTDPSYKTYMTKAKQYNDEAKAQADDNGFDFEEMHNSGVTQAVNKYAEEQSKPAAQEVKLGGGADTYYFEDPDNMSNEDKVFKSLGIELAETFGDHDGEPGNTETWANGWLDNIMDNGGLGIKSKKTRQPAAPVPAEEVMRIVEENPARWNRIIGNAKKFYEGKGRSTDFESDEFYPIKLVGGKTKPSAQYYAEGKRNEKNNPLTGKYVTQRQNTSKDAAPSLSEIVDRVYNIGEISEKTGLQKTAQGWRPVKKGAAGKTSRANKEEAIRKDLGLTEGEDMSRFSDEQIEKMYAKTQQTPEQQKADFDKSKIGQAVNKGRQEFAAEKTRQKELASKTNAIGLPKENKPSADWKETPSGRTNMIRTPEGTATVTWNKEANGEEWYGFSTVKNNKMESSDTHYKTKAEAQLAAEKELKGENEPAGRDFRSELEKNPKGAYDFEKTIEKSIPLSAGDKEVLGNVKSFMREEGADYKDALKSVATGLVNGNKLHGDWYPEKEKSLLKIAKAVGMDEEVKSYVKTMAKGYDFGYSEDAAPRQLTGDCRIRIRKEKPALTGDTKIRVRK